jgi:hypothetical protein
MSHPELVQLLDYLEQPDGAPHAATLDHLTDCAHCRARAAQLEQLQLALRRHVPRWHGMSATPPLPELHAAAHGAALRRDLAVSEPPRAMPRAQFAFQRIAELFTLRMPMWIPATTAAALMVAILGVPRFGADDAPALIAYQDAPVMHFASGEETQPGLGFFTGADRIERPFGGVEAARADARTLTLRWPAVEGAVEYRVTVSRVDGDTRQRLAEVTAIESQVRVANFDFIAHSRYEWTIAGQTHNGTWFSATGGFVVR